MLRFAMLSALCFILFAASGWAAPVPPSENPLEYYAQGGVVTNGIAYFAATTGRGDSQFVSAFDAETLAKIRRHDFGDTYDSTPYVYRKKDGTWLIAARQKGPGKVYQLCARRLDSDALEWTSPANLTTNDIYFGVSVYHRADGSQILFSAVGNGLHAISGETGEELWYLKGTCYGGATPAVDQGNGWVFYQNDGHLYKLAAETGKVIASKEIGWPNICSSFNTVFVNDSHGRFVLTRWHTQANVNAHYDCAIRVYDENLNLIWEKTGLPHGKKNTITYWDGKMLVGTGNHWGPRYTDAENETKPWKHLTAYNVADGSAAWVCDLSDMPEYRVIVNAPYFNGYIYAELEISGKDASLLRIRASDGKLMEVLNYGHRLDSCAQCLIAHGKLFSGNLMRPGYVYVTRIAENTHGDWPGLFYDPQTNVYAQPDDPKAVLVPMKLIGQWSPDLAVTVAAPASSASTNPIPFTIAFSKPVTGLTAADILVTNGNTKSLTGSGAGPYTVLVTPSESGEVTCQVKDWAVLDSSENGNRASNVCSIRYEPGAPARE